MGVYIYCLEEDYLCKSSIQGRKFENEWFKLEEDGTVTVKGSYKKGYSWDGCSPKIKFKDICLGTPDAVLSWTTRKPKTYYASMVHDVFYPPSQKTPPLGGDECEEKAAAPGIPPARSSPQLLGRITPAACPPACHRQGDSGGTERYHGLARGAPSIQLLCKIVC